MGCGWCDVSNNQFEYNLFMLRVGVIPCVVFIWPAPISVLQSATNAIT